MADNDFMSVNQWVLLGTAAVLVCWMLGAYNRLMAMRNAITVAAAQIDEPLRRRSELLLAVIAVLLIEWPDSEEESLQALEQAHTELLNAADTLKARPHVADVASGFMVAETVLQSGLTTLMAHLDHHPVLRRAEGLPERLAALRETQRRIRFGRQLFNDGVQAYNRALQQWPTRLLVHTFGLKPAGQI